MISILNVRSAYAASAGVRITDFNGDGFDDLAIGVPDESLNHNNIESAGAVNVIYGSMLALSPVIDPVSGSGSPDQFWNQNSPNVKGAAVADEDFGYVIAAGDFNGDNYSDGAFGNPAAQNGGEVSIIYGSSAGLSPSSPISNQLFWQGASGIEGSSDQQSNFGKTLTAGDYNNDGYDDLVIGNPTRDIITASGTQFDAGAVNVIYGSSQGLSALQAGDGSGQANQFWSQNTVGIDNTSDTFDRFGSSLTTGDFNNDGYDDLAVGVFGESYKPGPPSLSNNPGAVNIIYGSPDGLSATFVPDQYFNLFSPRIGEIDPGAHSFGYALTAGNFNGDDYDDLAVGTPGLSAELCVSPSNCLLQPEAGGAFVIYGSKSGLSPTDASNPAQVWHQWTPDTEGDPGSDHLGTSATAGDFNNDGYDDLALGAPDDQVPNVGEAGGVNIIYGSPDGLSATVVPDQLFSQNSPNIDETSALFEKFGQSLTTGDYNGDGYDDLAIGTPFEDVNKDTIDSAGAVNVIYGSSEGLSATVASDGTGMPDQVWTQNSADINDSAEEGDLFGSSLS